MSSDTNMSGSHIPIDHPASKLARPYHHIEIIDGEGVIVLNTKAYFAAQEPRFQCFSLLPGEIKAKIWKKSMKPQIVTILSNDHDVFENGSYIGTQHRVKAEYKVPALLHVCKESRAEGLKVYRPVFEWYTGGTPILFDFARDELFIKDSAAFYSWFESVKGASPDCEDFKSLRSLTIEDMTDYHWKLPFLGDWWHLDRLTIHYFGTWDRFLYAQTFTTALYPSTKDSLSDTIKVLWKRSQKEEMERAALYSYRVIGTSEPEPATLPTLEILDEFREGPKSEQRSFIAGMRIAETAREFTFGPDYITPQSWPRNEDLSNIDPALLGL
ncbi:hypothetical protein B7494_g3451 [Chlorociboria aeruginascens]|nr:hypothetical protein B7494_g3451 [Chlorociboria aeruginascens]